MIFYIYPLWLRKVAIFVYLMIHRKRDGKKAWVSRLILIQIFHTNILISKYLKIMLCSIKVKKLATLISSLVTIRMFTVDVVLYSKTKWCILVVMGIQNKWVYWNMYLSVNEIFIKVSVIDNCQMTRLDDLPFDYGWGSCNTFLEPNPRVLLCFSSNDPKVCHKWVF